MERDGFEIGSHTVSHANLGRLDEASLKCEVNNSLAALNSNLDLRPRSFSFPWGKLEDISEPAVDAVKAAGYYSSSSAYGGTNGPGQDRFKLRRVDAGNGSFDRLAFRARVAGFDPDYLRLMLKRLGRGV